MSDTNTKKETKDNKNRIKSKTETQSQSKNNKSKESKSKRKGNKRKRLPSFFEEKKLWGKGYIVIGVDEVGRGALAGPVVAGAVAYKNQKLPVKIDDSKRLTPIQREIAAKWIKKNCLGWAIGSVPVSYINKYGIVKATHKAFRQAIKKLLKKLKNPPKRYLLADAFHIKYVRGIGLRNQKAIVKGDQKSVSIASASIIAKVYRDRLMRGLHKKHKLYKWNRNKGYGTKRHYESLEKYGITLFHRKLFLKKWLMVIR